MTTPPREIWLERDACRLFALDEGTGPAVVMIHGGMADHRAVRPAIAQLTGFRVITPDLRGSGRSWYHAALSFDQFADDVCALLGHLSIREAVVGGISSGSGVALRFALRHPDRVRALMLVHPVYAGDDRGFTPEQAAAFQAMDAVASRAPAEGIGVLHTLYSRLPPEIAERAWTVAQSFDPQSAAATSHFLASGAQPFTSSSELARLALPTLVVPGNDGIHPPEVARDYLRALPRAFAPESDDVATAVAHFCAMTITGGRIAD